MYWLNDSAKSDQVRPLHDVRAATDRAAAYATTYCYCYSATLLLLPTRDKTPLTHTQTTNKNMKQPNSTTSGTSQLDTVQRTAFDTTLHQLQWLYHSTYIIRRQECPFHWILGSWPYSPTPKGLHCSWDRAPEVEQHWWALQVKFPNIGREWKREMVLNRDHVSFVGVLLRAFVLEKSWEYVALRAAKSLLSVKALRGATATACNSGGFLLDVTDDDEMEHETENNMEKHDNNSY